MMCVGVPTTAAAPELVSATARDARAMAGVIRGVHASGADVRVERVEVSLRKFRIAYSFPPETRFRRLIRWFLLRWRISWTLALLDRLESRRSRAMLEALTQLSRLCRVVAAVRMQHNQFSTRLSSHHSDDP